MSNTLKWQCLEAWLEQMNKQRKYGRKKPTINNQDIVEKHPKPKRK